MACREDWAALVVDALCRDSQFSTARRRTVEDVVRLAVEFVHEGREGRRIGTLIVIGDVDEILRRSRPLILDPLSGHDASLRRLDHSSFRETVKELAQLDGAFIVDDMGTFISAARFIEVTMEATDRLPTGLGARHAAAISISSHVDAIAVAISESSQVRIFTGGELRAEIAPGLFGGPECFAMDAAELHELPEVGLTVALPPAGTSRRTR